MNQKTIEAGLLIFLVVMLVYFLAGCSTVRVEEGQTYLTGAHYCSVRTSVDLPAVSVDYKGERCAVSTDKPVSD